jgi:Mechanosensitive ion channel, beta-domain
MMTSVGTAVPIARPVAVVFFIVAVFVAAWLVSRFAQGFATRFVNRSERRRRRAGGELDTATMTSLRQRETAIDLIETTVRYLAFATAVALSLVAISGAHRLQTIIGASFFAIVLGFAVQRFLVDVVAGLLMFFEGWFRIGDTVAIDVLNAQGVVEAVSLRALRIRTIRGEIVHVPNSQVVTLRVIPRGYREVEVEFFASEPQKGRELVEGVAPIVPVASTRFLRRPEIVETESLASDLYRITARFAVAAGREWLAEDFLPTLMKERAEEGLLAHGPVVTFVDERAAQSFARAAGRLSPLPVQDAHRRRALRSRKVGRATSDADHAASRDANAWPSRLAQASPARQHRTANAPMHKA